MEMLRNCRYFSLIASYLAPLTIVQGDLRQQVESELDTAEARIDEISHRLERRRSTQLRPSSLELIEFMEDRIAVDDRGKLTYPCSVPLY
jgi:hypothetical protein